MHILFLADASSVHSYRWIKYFSEKGGVSVTWCSFSQATMPELKNVEYKFIDKGSLLGLFRAFRYISRKSPDIIHAHYLGWNGLLSLLFPKSRLVLTAWGSDIVYNSKKRLMRFFIKRMMKRADLITCDAHHLRDNMIALGAPRENVEIVMFGIDENLFVSKRPPFTSSGEKVKFIVGSIRNLHPVYDVITLLKAAKIILSTRDDVEFNIAGSGPELKNLEDYVGQNDLSYRVNFLGRLESSELCDFYDDLDIYVSTALSDGGIASSTAEAMLCERPVVITNNAENSFWVEDHRNGRMFESSDHAELADIILELIEKQHIAIKFGLEAKETIIQRNSYKNEMKKMHKWYKNLVKTIN